VLTSTQLMGTEDATSNVPVAGGWHTSIDHLLVSRILVFHLQSCTPWKGICENKCKLTSHKHQLDDRDMCDLPNTAPVALHDGRETVLPS